MTKPGLLLILRARWSCLYSNHQLLCGHDQQQEAAGLCRVHLPPTSCLCPTGNPEWDVVKLILGDALSEKPSLIHLDTRSSCLERLGDDACCVCVLAQLTWCRGHTVVTQGHEAAGGMCRPVWLEFVKLHRAVVLSVIPSSVWKP